MFFNSVTFLIFFLIVYSLYLILSHKWQNFLLLVASYIFYGWWDWRFLSLILFSTVVDYFCALKIHESQVLKRRRMFLIISLIVNLTLLGFFKYFNFFASNMVQICNLIGCKVNPIYLNIILPVGISFYTFQTLSYTIDVYKREMLPTKKFLDFALYVSFFPQLVAGPIERAQKLLPQILNRRKYTLDDFCKGMFLIYWGLFEKIFIADNLASIVGPVFSPDQNPRGIMVLIASYAFAFQIFCDFDAYSNIARGIARCMGIELMVNFNLPYFARNPKEFWSRWHISLSTWLRDYLYIPLGGSRVSKWLTIRNLMLTMLLGGLWHGASWTFVLWGAYQGSLLIIYRMILNIKCNIAFLKIIPNWIGDFIKRFFFFHLIVLGWIIFRAESFSHLTMLLEKLFLDLRFANFVEIKGIFDAGFTEFCYLLFLIWPLLLMQVIQWRKNDLNILLRAPVWVRGVCYLIMYLLMRIFLPENATQFIYFQF